MSLGYDMFRSKTLETDYAITIVQYAMGEKDPRGSMVSKKWQ